MTGLIFDKYKLVIQATDNETPSPNLKTDSKWIEIKQEGGISTTPTTTECETRGGECESSCDPQNEVAIGSLNQLGCTNNELCCKANP